MSKPIALITGAAGSLAHLVATDLAADHDIIGLDTRTSKRPFAGEFYKVKHYNQRRVAEIFRRHPPKLMVHFGNVPISARNPNQRFTQNVLGTRNLLKQCLKAGTQRVIMQSTYHVYGAYQANHVNIQEHESLRAGQIYPEIADVVEMDHAATSFLWQNRELEVVVLRMANMVGPSLNNFLSRILRQKRVPRLLGYDPMLQFIQEQDASRAFTTVARRGGYGVYNVAGEGAVAWSWAIRHAGAQYVSVPHVLAYPLTGLLYRTRTASMPKHLIDFFRYPVIIDDTRFRKDFDFAPKWTTVDALASVSNR